MIDFLIFAVRSLVIFLIGLPFLLVLCKIGDLPGTAVKIALIVSWLGSCAGSLCLELRAPTKS